MDRLKTFRKYFLWIVGLWIFSTICIYVGLNGTYKDIELKEEISSQTTIRLAQATSVNGRILGEITSTDENNLEGKYIKVQIYSKKGNHLATKYLKIENTVIDEAKKFAVYFTADNVGYYTVDIVENAEKEQEEAELEYEGIFTDEELRTVTILCLLIAIS